MMAEANPERLLVADTATQRLLVSNGEGREEMPPEASGGVRWRSATARWGWQDSRLFMDGWLSVPNKFLRCYTALNPPLSSGEAQTETVTSLKLADLGQRWWFSATRQSEKSRNPAVNMGLKNPSKRTAR